MRLIEIRPPSRRELLVFGLLLLLFFALLGSLAEWRFGARAAARGLWATGAAVGSLHFAVPKLRPVFYYAWMKAAYPIGWTVSHAVLLLTYYGVLTPIGLLLRLPGRDLMQRTIDGEAETYWSERRMPRAAARYFEQY